MVEIGDDSIDYFHAYIKSRGVQNQILSFVDKGERIEDFERVKTHFLNHFKSFMGSASDASTRLDMKFVSQGPNLNLDQQLELIKPFT